MNLIKKILVFLTVGIMLALIIACLVFAIMGNNEAFTAVLWSIVVFPCIVYAILLVHKVLSKK